MEYLLFFKDYSLDIKTGLGLTERQNIIDRKTY